MLICLGISIKIEITKIIPHQPFPVDKIVPGEPGESTVTIVFIDDKRVPSVANGLLDILVSKKIIDVSTANSILVTFRK